MDALYDSNPHRRHAAARALGFSREGSGWALLDKSQPRRCGRRRRNLSHIRTTQAIPPLISVLAESDVRIRSGRFSHSAALGDGERDRRPTGVIEELERMLPDQEVPPGNWWSVGREALAMLGLMEPQYQARLDSETRRDGDAHSSPGRVSTLGPMDIVSSRRGAPDRMLTHGGSASLQVATIRITQPCLPRRISRTPTASIIAIYPDRSTRSRTGTWT